MTNENIMQAVVMDSPGGPDVMNVGSWIMPNAGRNEILLRVEAAGINRADTLQRQGKYPPPKGASPILGLEVAGRVEKLGESCSRWHVGDRVFGLLSGGGYAAYAVMHEEMAMPIPSVLSMVEAASIPEAFLTAYQSLFWSGRLREGEHVLVHAGASGVGTAAIQLAKDIGAHVVVTASASKHATCLNLGAEKAFDYKAGPFHAAVMEYTNSRGVDLILDFIAGPYYKQNIDSLSIDGRLVVLASLGGGKVDEIDLRQILMKRLTIVGSTLRSRNIGYQIKLTTEFSQVSLPLFESGQLKPVVDKVFNWREVEEAHRYMESNQTIGKIVLEVD